MQAEEPENPVGGQSTKVESLKKGGQSQPKTVGPELHGELLM